MILTLDRFESKDALFYALRASSAIPLFTTPQSTFSATYEGENSAIDGAFTNNMPTHCFPRGEEVPAIVMIDPNLCDITFWERMIFVLGIDVATLEDLLLKGIQDMIHALSKCGNNRSCRVGGVKIAFRPRIHKSYSYNLTKYVTGFESGDESDENGQWESSPLRFNSNI